PLDAPRIVEGRQRPAHLGACLGVVLAAELQEQAERARIAEDRQATRSTKARVEGPARRRLQEGIVVGLGQRRPRLLALLWLLALGCLRLFLLFLLSRFLTEGFQLD